MLVVMNYQDSQAKEPGISEMVAILRGRRVRHKYLTDRFAYGLNLYHVLLVQVRYEHPRVTDKLAP